MSHKELQVQVLNLNLLLAIGLCSKIIFRCLLSYTVYHSLMVKASSNIEWNQGIIPKIGNNFANLCMHVFLSNNTFKTRLWTWRRLIHKNNSCPLPSPFPSIKLIRMTFTVLRGWGPWGFPMTFLKEIGELQPLNAVKVILENLMLGEGKGKVHECFLHIKGRKGQLSHLMYIYNKEWIHPITVLKICKPIANMIHTVDGNKPCTMTIIIYGPPKGVQAAHNGARLVNTDRRGSVSLLHGQQAEQPQLERRFHV